MKTLNLNGTTITLPDDMTWVDEFDWEPWAQKKEYSLSGALITQSAYKLAGRPITLQGDQTSGWMKRSDLLTIASFLNAYSPGTTLTLVLDSNTFSVKFDHSKSPLTAKPVIDWADPTVDDFYTVTLRMFIA